MDDLLLRIVLTWRPSERPEYRGFRCANCQRFMRKAWHHWLDASGYRTPVHFCDACERKLRAGKIEVTKPQTKIDAKKFGKKFPSDTAKYLRAASAKWNTKMKPRYKTFECDLCGQKMRKAWHVWFNDRGTLVEAHFCKGDGCMLGLERIRTRR